MNLRRSFFSFLSIFLSIFFVLIFLEIICRIFIKFEKDYYTASKKLQRENIINHPYGQIPVNKEGFFDEDFDFKNNKKKIAYFGDSIVYGVGAGFPYRFTEYLDKLSPEFDHLNLSGGVGISLENWDQKHENFLITNKINRIIYVMNLNDIAPLSNSYKIKKDDQSDIKSISYLRDFILPLDKSLRGKSMLYTYVRFKIKTYFVKKGFEASGYQAIELFPLTNKTHIINAAQKIQEWSLDLKRKKIKNCIIIIPYEMQISKNARKYYKKIGINFDKGFENFLTQKIIKDNLSSEVDFLTIKNAFIEKKIGHYFVFNKGDKIDFNHPNREGHLAIAKEISKNKVCQE